MLVDGKRMHVRFVASPLEHKLATTDPVELAKWEELKGSESLEPSHNGIVVEAGGTHHD